MDLTDIFSAPDQAELFKRLPVALAVMEAGHDDVEILFVNAEWTRILGYTLDDIPRFSSWMRCAYPDAAYRAEVYSAWSAVMAAVSTSGSPMQTVESRVCDRAGRMRDLVFRMIVLNGRLLVAMTEVTQQRIVEEALRVAQAGLERTAYELTENIPVGTYTMVQPADGGMAHFAFMSRRFLELTGLTREVAAADPLQAFACVHPDDFDAWLDLNIKTFEKKTAFFGETRLIVNGEVRWVTAESIPRALPDGSTVWEGVLADITERKQTEMALLEAKQRAESLERLKGEFLANMSHEIRTPMNAVLGLVQLLLRENLAPRQEQWVRRIEDAGHLLLSLINDILDLSKIESGKTEIKPEPFVLQDFMDRIQGVYESLALGKPVEFRVLVQAETPEHLFGDIRRIEQVLANLLGNAIKFTEYGSIELDARVVTLGEGSKHLRFVVRDTGSGIATELQPDLFEPFKQGENSSVSVISGTGLGLTISKRLVELLGGTIGFQSTPGKGSEFWFEVPCTSCEAPSQSVSRDAEVTRARGGVKPSSTGSDPRLSGQRILIVDDSAFNRELLVEFITMLGGMAEQAADGLDALRILKTTPDHFAAVLMDVQMPRLDGLEATRRIRKDLGLMQLPILAVTAGVLDQEREKAFSAGMNDVLLKPLRLDDLGDSLRHWIDRAASASQEVHLIEPPIIDAISISEDVKICSYPEVAGIDSEHARRTTGDDPELFLHLLGVFCTEYGDTVDRIQGAIACGAHLDAARRLHAFRGAASYLGALRLAAIAQRLEKCLLAESEQGTEAMAYAESMKEFVAEIARVLGASKEHLDHHG